MCRFPNSDILSPPDSWIQKFHDLVKFFFIPFLRNLCSISVELCIECSVFWVTYSVKTFSSWLQALLLYTFPSNFLWKWWCSVVALLLSELEHVSRIQCTNSYKFTAHKRTSNNWTTHQIAMRASFRMEINENLN